MAEYAAGRTPNPCLRCNEKIKFAAVLDRALALGFDAVATGHYAQLRTGADGLIEMHRAVDHGQGPVLRARRARPRSSCAHSLFPLGDSRKAEVRARGRARAGCWSPTSPTATTSASSPTATPPAGCARSSATAPNHGGDDRRRRHRRGARQPRRAPTASPSASARGCGSAGRRRTASRASCSTSSRSPAPSPSARARSWPSTGIDRHPAALVRRRARPAPLEGTVQLRAHGDEHRAVVDRRRRRRSTIELLDPAQGIAPGQAAVVYDGTRVVGSATIAATVPGSGPPQESPDRR